MSETLLLVLDWPPIKLRNIDESDMAVSRTPLKLWLVNPNKTTAIGPSKNCGKYTIQRNRSITHTRAFSSQPSCKQKHPKGTPLYRTFIPPPYFINDVDKLYSTRKSVAGCAIGISFLSTLRIRNKRLLNVVFLDSSVNSWKRLNSVRVVEQVSKQSCAHENNCGCEVLR